MTSCLPNLQDWHLASLSLLKTKDFRALVEKQESILTGDKKILIPVFLQNLLHSPLIFFLVLTEIPSIYEN